MTASILIVSRNRKKDLRETLRKLITFISEELHEILVYLDNSEDGSISLKEEFPKVHWYGQNKTLGASRARQYLYTRARGRILIGFDDDAHPLTHDFITKSLDLFQQYPNTGIIAYREIKGKSIKGPLLTTKGSNQDFLTKDFMGCGFVIRKDVYEKTRGFPEWIDIYGEESCLALETLALGYDILFTYQIAVHHRVDREERKNSGRNYLRFGKQLKNTSFYYLVYYPFPLVLRKIVRLYLHNFRKYAMKDMHYFKAFWWTLWQVLRTLPVVLHYRKPVSKELLLEIRDLKNPDYHFNTPSL